MTAAADRHLLFGLLALQNGLIDQGALVAAFQAWTRDKSRSLADQLVARGDLDADARAGLEAIVALHVKKHGDVEHSLAAVPANRSTRAGLADLGEPEIEAMLARVAPTRNGQPAEVDGDPDRTATPSVGAATSDGQRFRLLRLHARGGLGDVFVALDAELHREVALKQILERHADDPVSRQRFVAEAEITGGLEHPGVVPVYGLGTYGDGRPYYAMRFIRGDSLKEAIEHFHRDAALKSDPGRRSLELRKLLRRFLDVCNAVDYAHSRGVIHRDLKPANILVTPADVVKVIDFGIARLPSYGSGGNHNLVGTALYMAPEQLHAQPADARADVYSMGVILYEALAGTHPLGLVGTATVFQVFQQHLVGEPPPLRDLAPEVPPDLAALVHEALARDPRRRTPSMKALAVAVWFNVPPPVIWKPRPLSPMDRAMPLFSVTPGEIEIWAGLRPSS